MKTALPLVLSLLSALSRGAAAGPAGPLVLIGGGEKPPAALAAFVRLAGGPDARIVVVPTASGEADTGTYYQDLFRREHGCRRVIALPVRTRADASKAYPSALVDRASGVFFAGGDQNVLMATLAGTPLDRALRRLQARGGVVGGTSAGTACQSDPMLTGEGDLETLRTAPDALAPGLGSWPGVLVDQHFVRRRRSNRLLAAVLANPTLLGVGIDEDTAVVVGTDGRFEVLGTGWVVVMDARSARIRRARDGALGADDLRVHVLLPGDRFDPAGPAGPAP